MVIVEGKKAQQVVFGFPAVSADVGVPTRDVPLDPPPLAHLWARPFAGGLLAGAVLATGTGAVLGAFAIAKKQDANCDAAHLCDGEPLGDARSTARSATIAFGLGGALAVASVVTFFAFGRTRVRAAASLGHLDVSTTW